MEVYKHFGLSAPPFEGTPAPRFFHAAASHAETLATLQYAVHSGKACTLVLGDSGSGKTLLGRMLVQSSAERTGVLWVHGIGQPAGETNVTICSPAQLKRPDAFSPKNLVESTLAYWIRTALPASQATIVVVDNADGLRDHSWEDILALVTREIRAPKPISVALLGLPSLVETLAAPTLLRLRRRVFRTCHLSRLTREDVAAYVRHRLAVAGGGQSEIFTSAALDLIYRFSDGNPALVNQLCDNAMVDAFGDDRTQIDGRDILTTLHAITGGIRRRRYLPKPTAASRARGITPVVPDECRVPARLRRVVAEAWTADMTEPTEMTTEDWGVAQPPPALHQERSPTQAQPGAAGPRVESIRNRPDGTDAADMPDDTYTPLDERLRTLESRLSDALARVRDARARPGAFAQLPAGGEIEESTSP